MKKIFYYSFILILLASGARNVLAADNQYTLLEPLPCIAGTGNGDCTEGKVIEKITIDQYIGYVFKFSIALAVFLATIMVIFGGFQYMTSEVPSVKSDGKGRIQSALTGLGFVLISYLVLQTIDPRLVQINTGIDPICVGDRTKAGGLCYQNALKEYLGLFQDDLAGNITKLNEADKAKVATLQKEAEGINDSIRALEKIKAEGNITPEQESNLAAFKLDVKRREAQAQKLYAEVRGSSNFSDAITYLYDIKNFTFDEGRGGVPFTKNDVPTFSTNQENAISSYTYNFDAMNEYAKKLDDLGDHVGASEVRVRSLFYKEQVEEQKTFVQHLIAAQYCTYNCQEKGIKALKEDLKNYSVVDTSKPGSKIETELLQEQADLNKKRVDLINLTLSQKTK